MPHGYLLDTHIITYWADPSSAQFQAIETAALARSVNSPLYVSVITLGEIEYGHAVYPSGAGVKRAVQACPFLMNPAQHRREKGIPAQAVFSETGLKRNPGVMALWTTKSYHRVRGLGGEVLYAIGPALQGVQWFCEGRPATRVEAGDALESGCVVLREQASVSRDLALERELAHRQQAATAYLPTA